MNQTIEHISNGAMNLDDPDFVLPQGYHRTARNIIFRGSKGNMQVENIVGNSEIVNALLPATGTNKNIGAWYDSVNKRIFFFNCNTNHHGIYIYNTLLGTFQRLVEVGINTDGDILAFDYDVYITSVDIIYVDGNAGDILFWVDSLGRPSKLNIQRYLANTYTTIERDYIDVAKAPPVMPIQCTYENDTTVNVNNLLNSLFQFSYSFIYDDNEESVLTSGSITPLPAITFSSINTSDKSKSSRISLYVETGDIDVKKIRIYGRQTKNSNRGDWFIVNTLDKSYFSIASNTIYRYEFKNDGLYTAADPKFTVLLQDYVPQKANAQALLNGNTLSYGGITEGYDYINSSYAIAQTYQIPPLFTINGVLFFAYQPKRSNNVTIYLTGVGTNDGTTGKPTVLDTPPLNLYVRAKVGSTDKSFNITNTVETNIVNILSALQTAAVTAGWTAVSTTPNSITISLTSVVLQSSYIYQQNDAVVTQQAFAHYPNSGYSYGVVYYDNKGRTNGVITDITANVTTVTPTVGYIDQLQITLTITPPLWAVYYDLVRTNTLTYNKYKNWITNGAYSNVGQFVATQYAYLQIDNMFAYNTQIQSTDTVVSYDFAQGDRVKITGVYAVSGTLTTLNFDYQILNVVVNPLLNGIQKTGTFIQIAYPTADISSTFKFDGTPDFQNYQILIYSLADHAPSTTGDNLNVYYRIGQRYGIGLAGTVSAYHMANYADNVIKLSDGDVFFRTRTVPTGATYYLPSGNYKFGNQYTTFLVNFNNVSNDITTTNYVIGHQSNTQVTGNNTPSINAPATSYPLYANNALFSNISANPISIRIRGEYTLSLSATAGSATTSGMYIKMINTATTNSILQIVVEQKVLQINTNYDFAFDATIVVPAGYKVFIIASNLTQAPDFSGLADLTIGQFTLRLDVLTNITINVYDSSFSDTYKLITNNDSQPVLSDKTALQTTFNTLFRFSKDYQLGTNINNTNRFYFNDFDEFDKSFGAIKRMIVYKRTVNIFQERKVGFINVYGKIITNNDGQNQLVTTDTIITPNNIQYYDGNAGVGNQPTAVCVNGYDFYYMDDVTGYLYRKSMNGNIPISEVFKVQAWSGVLTKYLNNNAYVNGGNAKLICAVNFLPDRNTEILFMKQGSVSAGITGETLSWIEDGNRFQSLYDMNFDNLICAENQLYSFTNGKLYIHNNTTTYANFNGTQFYPSIQIVFNKETAIRKTFNGVHYVSNQVWLSDTNGDIYTSEINEQTGLIQQSSLKLVDYTQRGNFQDANFWRDANSNSNAQEGLVNGDYLQGCYISVNFTYKGVKFVKMFLPYVSYQANNPNF